MKKPRRSYADTKIQPATAMRCEAGHDFTVDMDKLGKFYGRLPSTVRCPHPKCGIAVSLKPSKQLGEQ